MAWNPTPSQSSAMEVRGKTVLVSAAAGSGKTATLTERIIRKLRDRENPADISRMLIVTFTKAAASDLRLKISRELNRALANEPENRYLYSQMMKIGNADICTMDSFYYKVVKSHFERLGLPSRISIMDGSEASVMKQRILSEIIDDFYETKGEPFRRFMDSFMTTRGMISASISKEIFRVYDKVLSYPEGVEIIKKNEELLFLESTMPFFESRAGKSIRESALSALLRADKILDELIEEAVASKDIAAAFGPALAYDREHFALTAKALEEGDYEKAVHAFSSYSPITVRKRPEGYQRYGKTRKRLCDEYEKFAEKYFSATEEAVLREFAETASFASVLYDVISELDTRFSAEKRERGLCDFTDNKRFAMKLFIGEDGEPTDIAKSYSEKYDEIYIDEYQDTDFVQDAIFRAISRPGNRFMVGDIKQSIYCFRGANSSVFSRCKNSFPLYGEDDTSSECSIYMSENFRCDEPIIDTTNRICGHVFSKGPNNIGYTEDDRLRFAKKSSTEGRTSQKVRYDVIRTYSPSALEKLDEESAAALSGSGPEGEIRNLVSHIKRLLLDENALCEDGGKLRRIEPRDIAVLVRKNSKVEEVSDALTACGIPCSARTRMNFFDNPEIILALSLLRVIDNPQRDVYLAGVLRSALFGFDLDELVQIRSCGEGGSLYDDLVLAAENSENAALRKKIAVFREKLELYRARAALLPADKLIRYVYSDTMMLSLAARNDLAPEGDEQKRANLLMLYDYARRFEDGAYKGLYSFISYIDELCIAGENITPPSTGETSNLVRVMTMHASKGLEFPVCFIPFTKEPFSSQWKKDVIHFDEELGFSALLRDESSMATFNTVLRRAVIEKSERSSREEEMRLLYVAMTRAREQLYMSAASSSLDWEKDIKPGGAVADEYSIMSSGNYFSWVTSAYSEEGDEICRSMDLTGVDISLVPRLSHICSLPKDEPVEKEGEKSKEELLRELSDRFSYEYPYSHLSRLPAKLSVSKLYPEVLDEGEAKEALTEKISLRDMPAFLMPEEERATAAERGTATHTFMQFCDFEHVLKFGVRDEIARMCSVGLMDKKMAELINVRHIERFFRSNFWRETEKAISEGGKIYREQRFNIKLPASHFTADEAFASLISDEEIVVQGVIDLLVVAPDGSITLCDYKTDYLTDEEMKDISLLEAKMLASHESQLSYYKTAVKRIFGRAPSRTVIYSLPFGEAVDLDIDGGIE